MQPLLSRRRAGAAIEIPPAPRWRWRSQQAARLPH